MKLKQCQKRVSFIGALLSLTFGAWAQSGLHCSYQISGAPFAEVELQFSENRNFLPDAKVIFYGQASLAHVQEDGSTDTLWKLRLNQAGDGKPLFMEISRDQTTEGHYSSTLSNPDMPFVDKVRGLCAQI